MRSPALRSFLVLLALVPGVAAAQTLSVQPDELAGTGRTELFLDQDECEGTLRISWAINGGFTPCSTPAFRIWLTAAEAACGDEPDEGRGDIIIRELSAVEAARLGSESFEIQLEDDLPFFDNPVDGGRACPAPRGTEIEHNLCASVRLSDTVTGGCTSDADFLQNSPGIKITYDALPPDAPTLEGVGPQEEGLVVTTTDIFDEEDATFIRIQLRGPTDADFRQVAEGSATERRFTVTGLENGTTYTVRAVAVDEAGNVSDPSGELSGTPLATEGFFGNLRRNGSQETGGCGAVGGAAAGGGLLALMALWAGSRRRR